MNGQSRLQLGEENGKLVSGTPGRGLSGYSQRASPGSPAGRCATWKSCSTALLALYCLLPVTCSFVSACCMFYKHFSELKIRLWRSTLWIEQLLKLRTVILLIVGLSQPEDCDIGLRMRDAID